MMVYLKSSDYIGNQQFSCRNNFDFHFFLISDTQLSLLKVLHSFKAFYMQEKNSFIFEQPPQCSPVTRSISHGSLHFSLALTRGRKSGKATSAVSVYFVTKNSQSEAERCFNQWRGGRGAGRGAWPPSPVKNF